MNQIGAFFQRYLKSVIAVAGVLVLLLVWQLAWMSPKASQISADQATAATDESTISSLRLEIEQLIQERSQVLHELPYLKRFPQEIPPTPEYGILVQEIQTLEQETGVTVNPLSVSKVLLGTTGITDVPVNIQVTGGHDQILAFLAGLTGTGPDAIKRLVTVQTFGLNGPTPNVLQSSQAPFTASFAATAYTTGTAAAPGAAGSVG